MSWAVQTIDAPTRRPSLVYTLAQDNQAGPRLITADRFPIQTLIVGFEPTPFHRYSPTHATITLYELKTTHP